YIIYREYRRREKLKKGRLTEDPRIPYRTMYESLLWNLEHQCETIEKLNKIIRDGNIPGLVKSFEQNFSHHIQNIAKEISQEKDDVKLIIVAGPSSSGKTTTTAKLAHQLNEAGLDTVALNLDHYFFDLEYHPKDEYGDYDFETPEALDITLINQHLVELIDGKTIKMPYYDFAKGKRQINVQEKAILPNQVIIIDTLHGLYEPMTQSVPSENKVKVYIETISQLKDNDDRFIRWTDIRLLRRMVRDSASRGYDMRQTIGHWHYVRRSELKHIIPFQGDTDFVVNGAIPFELPYLKKFTFESLPDYIKEWQDDPKRRDAFIRTERIHKLLSQVDDFYDEKIIPWDSLLREFIGGSVLKLH
ncbi:MAG: nucleoside kinase, partial [Candidatus Marinimicrobia bacterium]|nr:nucleoside kinase [Candidatus Neomarinimicrobiota bacterium]